MATTKIKRPGRKLKRIAEFSGGNIAGHDQGWYDRDATYTIRVETEEGRWGNVNYVWETAEIVDSSGSSDDPLGSGGTGGKHAGSHDPSQDPRHNPPESGGSEEPTHNGRPRSEYGYTGRQPARFRKWRKGKKSTRWLRRTTRRGAGTASVYLPGKRPSGESWTVPPTGWEPPEPSDGSGSTSGSSSPADSQGGPSSSTTDDSGSGGAQAPTSDPWDLTGDGEVNILDVAELRDRVDDLDAPAGDVNDDGRTNIVDVGALLDRVNSGDAGGSTDETTETTGGSGSGSTDETTDTTTSGSTDSGSSDSSQTTDDTQTDTMANHLPTSDPWDFTGDGEVTVTDAQALLNNIDQLEAPVGDVNDDGTTDIRDARALMQQVSGGGGGGRSGEATGNTGSDTGATGSTNGPGDGGVPPADGAGLLGGLSPGVLGLGALVVAAVMVGS